MNLAAIVDPWSRGPKWFRRTRGIEIATVVVIVAAAGVESWRIAYDHQALGGGYIDLLITLAGIALAWYRPWPGILLTASGPLVAMALGWDPLVPWTMTVFATFVFTLRGLPGLPVGILVAAANFTAVAVSNDIGVANVYAAVAAISALAAAAAGSAIRGHRQYWDELQKRTQDAVSNRELEVEHRVAEERLRIARDLHDVVGHEVAVISMHLGAAEIHLPVGADASRNDLAAARVGVQSVLRETQSILAVLRVGSEDDPLTPAAGYAGIVDLVETFRSAGLVIDADIDQTPMALSPNVSTAAYRIAQEALTNAQRHGTGSVHLRVEVGRRSVTVEARNAIRGSGSGPDRTGSGYGLVGMRERASSAGGRLDVDTVDGFFRVRAVLGPDAPEASR
ncbi:sensor histidine kinase [Gordonia rubripertincta]|uniref:histidine kinase n=1 Tax=Gordonia rubripertincta TaxID=36822 RepID=A0ABT4N071_GORRU|nr:histidine kinase [Gordonia rubripertincta]MCZ4551347.1 histidine kinase [Gordonia rubripertincta]